MGGRILSRRISHKLGAPSIQQRRPSKNAAAGAQQVRCCISTITEFSLDDADSLINKNDVHTWIANTIQPNFQSQQPVLMRNAAANAPATKLWKSWDYWHETVGHEIAKVEIGGSYGDEESARAEIPVEGYLQYLQLFEGRHGKSASHSDIYPPPKQDEMVYMAQNDLFHSLYKDVLIPDFCQDESNLVGLGRLYSVMLWLGPHGSVSPMHNDPLDNLLMQYVGRKKILLYPPTTQVYAGHNGQQSNTSPIEPALGELKDSQERNEHNQKHFPLFEPDMGFSCELRPGDILYIPSKWYHFVQSLDMSASVNIWWR